MGWGVVVAVMFKRPPPPHTAIPHLLTVSVPVCVSVSDCQFACLHLCLSVSLRLCLSVCLSRSLALCLCLSVSPPPPPTHTPPELEISRRVHVCNPPISMRSIFRTQAASFRPSRFSIMCCRLASSRWACGPV